MRSHGESDLCMVFELEAILFGIQNVELRGDRSHPLSVTLEKEKRPTSLSQLKIFRGIITYA
jgi:hypothetical protein